MCLVLCVWCLAQRAVQYPGPLGRMKLQTINNSRHPELHLTPFQSASPCLERHSCTETSSPAESIVFRECKLQTWRPELLLSSDFLDGVACPVAVCSVLASPGLCRHRGCDNKHPQTPPSHKRTVSSSLFHFSLDVPYLRNESCLYLLFAWRE